MSLIAIKEQGYLQKETAEEKYLDSQTNKRMTDHVQSSRLQVAFTAFEVDPNLLVASGSQVVSTANKNKPTLPLTLEHQSKIAQSEQERFYQEELVQNRQTIDEATKMLQEQQRESHRQVVEQWILKKERKKENGKRLA